MSEETSYIVGEVAQYIKPKDIVIVHHSSENILFLILCHDYLTHFYNPLAGFS
ncbi:MAG: hypothetical protein ACJ71K_09055 [Nitrososphaeraceae archaeon]